MKITVRGISDERIKDEVKAIIREYCECDSVYAKGFFQLKTSRDICEGLRSTRPDLLHSLVIFYSMWL